MQPNQSGRLGHLRHQLSCLFLAAMLAAASSTVPAAEPNIIALLGRNPETAKKLGLEKLSAEEKEEWNRLLTTTYLAGANVGRTNWAGAVAITAPANVDAQSKGTSRFWLSKADLESDDIVKLENGAIFKVASGLVGVGIRRTVALIQEGSQWSLWVARKRVFRGELLRAPDSGKPIAFKRATIASVTSDGVIVRMTDESIYEIDLLGRIQTMLWLPTTEVFILESGKMINPTDTGGDFIECRPLK